MTVLMAACLRWLCPAAPSDGRVQQRGVGAGQQDVAVGAAGGAPRPDNLHQRCMSARGTGRLTQPVAVSHCMPRSTHHVAATMACSLAWVLSLDVQCRHLVMLNTGSTHGVLVSLLRLSI